MKFSDGLFLKTAQEVAENEYGDSGVEFEDRIVDNMCMQLVQKPELYDVLVLPNLYGDIVSDLGAGLIGGLGVAPGGNIGDDAAVFEPTHGSAPKYAGQNKVNPMAMMLSGVLMLQPPRRDRCGRAPREGDRRRHRRGQRRHLRHEAEPRRPDRGRDLRGRRRDHREAGGVVMAGGRQQGNGRRRGQRRFQHRASHRREEPRRRGRDDRHRRGASSGSRARHQPVGPGRGLRDARRRHERLRGHGGLGRRRDHRRAPAQARACAAWTCSTRTPRSCAG